MAPRTGEPAASGVVLVENLTAPVKLDYSPLSGKFSYAPRDDQVLTEEEDGRRRSKKALALVELPGSGDIAAFYFDVSRSRWSTRKIGLGLGALAATLAVASIIVVRRRRRFKYNDRD
jgi:hypothetical protein